MQGRRRFLSHPVIDVFFAHAGKSTDPTKIIYKYIEHTKYV